MRGRTLRARSGQRFPRDLQAQGRQLLQLALESRIPSFEHGVARDGHGLGHDRLASQDEVQRLADRRRGRGVVPEHQGQDGVDPALQHPEVRHPRALGADREDPPDHLVLEPRRLLHQVQRGRLAAGRGVEDREVVQAGDILGAAVAERRGDDPERLRVERLRLGGLAHLEEERGQVVQGDRELGVVGAEDPARDPTASIKRPSAAP